MCKDYIVSSYLQMGGFMKALNKVNLAQNVEETLM